MSIDLTRAREYLDRGQLVEAAALAEKVIRRSAKDADALLLRGLVSVAKPDVDDAAHWLRRAVRAAPNRWDVQYDVAIAYLRLDRIDEALRRLEVAANLNPSSLETQLQLGRVHLDRLKQPSAAAKAFHRAIELAPR